MVLSYLRCDFPLAHEEAPPQDPQGSAQGRLHRRMASFPHPVHRGACWTEGIPPQDRDQQEDLRHAGWLPQEGRKGKIELRLHVLIGTT